MAKLKEELKRKANYKSFKDPEGKKAEEVRAHWGAKIISLEANSRSQMSQLVKYVWHSRAA